MTVAQHFHPKWLSQPVKSPYETFAVLYSAKSISLCLCPSGLDEINRHGKPLNPGGGLYWS